MLYRQTGENNRRTTMNEKEQLLSNLDKINVSQISEQVIRGNLHIDPEDNVIDYCRKKLVSENCSISRLGSSWFCRIDNIVIPVNMFDYSILTAHELR